MKLNKVSQVKPCGLPNGEIQNLFVLGSDIIVMHFAITIMIDSQASIRRWILHQCLF